MFCTKCGSPLIDGAKFCGNCGSPVGEELVEITASADPAEASVSESVAESAPAESEMQTSPAEPVAESTPAESENNGVGVPDITITAAKWLPDDGQPFPVQQEEGKKKKSRKGLIITLCAVVLVLGVVIGGAFFLSRRYSIKVAELKTYKNSEIIKDLRDEYSELLSRAVQSEGVLHVIETFSMNDEIDSFLGKIEDIKAELPDKAIKENKKLAKLGDNYYIDEWGSQINKYASDSKKMIEEQNYESLVMVIEQSEELYDEIVKTNLEYKDQLVGLRDKLIDIRSELSSYALYRYEGDELIGEVDEVLASETTKEVPYYIKKTEQFIATIEEANRPFSEIEERKKYYDDLFKDVEIIDQDRYSEILTTYSDALIVGMDSSKVSEILDEYVALYEETHEANTEEYLKIREKVEGFDKTRLEEAELEEFDKAYAAMKGAEGADKIAEALDNARKCEAYVDVYIQKITEYDSFMTLATSLASDFFFNYGYGTELSEEQMYYICENVLTDELIEELRVSLDWGENSEVSEEGDKNTEWKCGFSRAECEELAYYITGQKHYYYKEISEMADSVKLTESVEAVRTTGISVEEKDDGSFVLSYDIQVLYDGAIYEISVNITAVYNEDSFFDQYSIASIEMSNYREIDYRDAYIKALDELYEYQPDHYTQDQFGRRMSFVYVDDDHIPEIYINSVYGYASAYLVSFEDNEKYHITQLESGDGFSEYVPGKGVVRSCDGRQGFYTDTVIELKNDGTTELVFKGEYSYVDFDSEEMKYDVIVPEELSDTESTTYYNYLDEYYTSKGESQNLTGDYTLEEMLQVLDSTEPESE